MAQDRVKRNVVELTDVPINKPGRPSKALTPEQVDAVLLHTNPDRMHGYVVVSILTGARTEELCGLRWDHVFLGSGSGARSASAAAHRGVAVGPGSG